MSTKRLVTIGLLAFLGMSFVYLVAGDRLRGGSGSQAAIQEKKAGTQIVAYYLHTTGRCTTCYKLEKYTHAAITGEYGKTLATGRLSWQVVNVETPGNEHFVKEFQLSTKSVVLVEMTDGVQRRWKNLNRIWDEVDNEASFKKYIVSEVREFGGATLKQEI